MDTVGARIRKIREIRHLTQKELASRAGIHEVLMRRYEYGDRNPKREQLEKIAKALEVDVSIFLLPECSSISAMLYSIMEKYGEISVLKDGTNYYVGVKESSGQAEKWNQDLSVVLDQQNLQTQDDFQKWLMTCTDTEIYFKTVNKTSHEK